MDVKAAVATAKSYVRDVFADEQIENLGLEEVQFEESSDTWRITIGFSRPWDRDAVPFKAFTGALSPLARSYKVVRLSDADGKVLSVTSLDVPTRVA